MLNIVEVEMKSEIVEIKMKKAKIIK